MPPLQWWSECHHYKQLDHWCPAAGYAKWTLTPGIMQAPKNDGSNLKEPLATFEETLRYRGTLVTNSGSTSFIQFPTALGLYKAWFVNCKSFFFFWLYQYSSSFVSVSMFVIFDVSVYGNVSDLSRVLLICFINTKALYVIWFCNYDTTAEMEVLKPD